jgi:hypothetical protein
MKWFLNKKSRITEDLKEIRGQLPFKLFIYFFKSLYFACISKNVKFSNANNKTIGNKML